MMTLNRVSRQAKDEVFKVQYIEIVDFFQKNGPIALKAGPSFHILIILGYFRIIQIPFHLLSHLRLRQEYHQEMPLIL